MTHTRWVRFLLDGTESFGQLQGERVLEHRGSLFGDNAPTGRSVALQDVKLLAPVQPTKVIALWNNFGQLREKLQLGLPEEPLYLLKSPNSWSAHEAPIPLPRGGGKVVFEGELGIVIGRRCASVSEADAPAHVFGYTCGNDVTLADVLNRDASFTQWTRAKGIDGFCPLGPAVATGLGRAAGEDAAGRPGPAGLPDQRHDLFGGPAGEPHLRGHDPAAGRCDPVRHVGRRRLHQAGQPRRSGDRRHRAAGQPARMNFHFEGLCS